jgi:hypothetical protein
MKPIEITRRRLHNQGLIGAGWIGPVEVVRSQGAVQAQDYAAAKWALALRTPGQTDSEIDRLFGEGAFLRTHVLRPTWHFVTPEDIGWMLELSAPRVHAVNAGMYRKAGLDESVFKRCHTVLRMALSGGGQFTRPEIATALERGGIATDGGFRMVYLLMQAELEGVLCSGARRGKPFTYALLEGRAPRMITLTRDQAVVKLTKRYFLTRGPATLQDFTVWSGLTLADARRGVEELDSVLERDEIDGKTCWFPASGPAKVTSPTVHLLPNYDEYFIGFKDRKAISSRADGFSLDERTGRYALAAHIVFIDGQVVGGWKRTLKKSTVEVEFNPLVSVTGTEKQAVVRAAERYGAFLEMPVELIWRKSPSRG